MLFRMRVVPFFLEVPEILCYMPGYSGTEVRPKNQWNPYYIDSRQNLKSDNQPSVIASCHTAAIRNIKLLR